MKAGEDTKTVVYARVSSQGQNPDLQNQREAIKIFCAQADDHVDEWIEEIGSGLNDQRKHFNRLMQEIELGQVKRLVIAHKDQLVRFGFEWFAAFCEQHHIRNE